MPGKNNKTGLPIIGHKQPCECTKQLLQKLIKNKIAIIGAASMKSIKGHEHVGLFTLNTPTVIGARPSEGLIVFTFCPFCGVRLEPEVDHGSDDQQSQN